jgi:6-phosphogluconolactonase
MSKIELIDRADAIEIANWVEARLRAALAATQDPVAITVPGGSTPFPIFEELVTRTVDWNRVEIWPGDDRIVPEDHSASNTGKLRAIFEPAGAQILGLDLAAEPPQFALAWLGMGGDGHIASLFPNTDPQVAEPEQVLRLTPDPLPPEAPFDRITLTIPALLNSDQVMFTLGGSADKREVFEKAARGAHDLPVARFLAAAAQPVTCFT